MSPLLASTSTKSPSLKVWLANFVPTTQGILSSLEIIAAWHAIPPSSVTIALDLRIKGIRAGFVVTATRISPSLNSIFGLDVKTSLTLPLTFPG